MLAGGPGAVKFPLDRIESQLQNLIEGSLAALIPGAGRKNPLASQMVLALHAGVRVENGIPIVPGNYAFFTGTRQYNYWQAHPAELEGLANVLHKAGQSAGYRFSSIPRLILLHDPALPEGETRISAQAVEETGETAVMEVEHSGLEQGIPANAFLIVNGIRMVPLQQVVINIGRREDNHLVTDDPRVSRTHAQIRAVHGVYYLFDLNSTGGTFVNGERISRIALKPGDVISLAGYPLIFGQDTQPITPSSPGMKGLQSGTTDELRSIPEDPH
jgi:hypothetical protein